MAKLPQSCGAGTAVGALGQRDGGAGGIKPRRQRSRRQHRELTPVVLKRRRGRILPGAARGADMELDVEKAKELIDQKLAEEEEEEKRLKGDGPREPPAVERMSTPELEEEKRQGPRNRGIEAIKVRAGCGEWGAGGHGGDERGAACPRRARSGCGGARWTCAGRSSTWGAYSASSSCASSAASAGRSGRPPPSPRRRRSPWRSYVQGLPGKPGCPGGAGHGAPCCPRCPSPALPCPQEGPVEPETFLRAAVQGKIRVIEKFLADGGPPDTCDEFHRTALHRSSLEGHTDILQKLLDSGATVDFRDRVRPRPAPIPTGWGSPRQGWLSPGRRWLWAGGGHRVVVSPRPVTQALRAQLDCTAVHWACRGGHLDAVKLLQDHGADLNLKDKLLSTPLHVATRTGHPDIVEHLIHCGVDINSPDREGDTALHDATRLSRYKIIKMLILHGADMMAKNQAGKTPTELVQQWQTDTRQALETKEQPQGEAEVPA
nr:ankyrin repeat domain-containing protein 2 isoform X2 [Anser cygnoides]